MEYGQAGNQWATRDVRSLNYAFHIRMATRVCEGMRDVNFVIFPYLQGFAQTNV